MSGRRREGTPRTVTARLMTILSAFSQDHPVLGLADICRRTGLSSSTTHRLVGELTEWGALARTSDLRYHIGPMLRRLGTVTLSDSAHPPVIDLREGSRRCGDGRKAAVSRMMDQEDPP